MAGSPRPMSDGYFMALQKMFVVQNILVSAKKLTRAAGGPMEATRINLLEDLELLVVQPWGWEGFFELDSDFLRRIDLKMAEAKEFFEVPKWFPPNALPSLKILAIFLNLFYEIIHFQAGHLSSKFLIQILKQDVRFLTIFLAEISLQCTEFEIGGDLLKNIEVVANYLGKITYLLFLDKMGEVTAGDFSLLLKEMGLVKAKIKNYVEVLKLPRQRTSMNDDFVISYVDSFLQRLKHLWNIKADHLDPVKDDIKILEDELKSLIFTIKQISEQQKVHKEELKAVVTQVGGVTEEAEYLVDCCGVCPKWYLNGRFSQILEEIQLIKAKMAQISVLKARISDKKDDNEVQKGEFNEVPSQATHSKVKDVVGLDAEIKSDVVGLDAEIESLRELLTSGSNHLKVISIVGMAGLGKTTLAQKLYNDPYIVYHFHIRAQCTVSQSHCGRDLLLAILKSFVSSEKLHEMREKSDEDLPSELRKQLKGKKYLIFMDDIWNKSAWDELRRSFPDDSQGSRVIITSRLKNVALQIEPDDRFIFEPNFLSNEECWDLLQQKVFQTKCCPSYLLKVGKHIASLCQGLPLAVVAVAGILTGIDKIETSWKEVATSLSSHILRDSEWLMALLEESYKHLPNHLRPCFLYCGAFPEDTEIKSRELTWLWIAEGLVPYTEEKRIEDVAEEYLKDLISRSLLIVAKRRSDEGVKACRVHDLFRDLCLRICSEENFLKVISGPSSSYEKCPRLCFDPDYQTLGSFNPRVHSLLGIRPLGSSRFRYRRVDSRHFQNIYRVKPNSPSCRFLRVLHLWEYDMDYTVFPVEVALLVSLRYLAIRGKFRSFATLGSLFSLEILLLRITERPAVFTCPQDILTLANLRHLFTCPQDILTLPNLRHLFVDPNIELDKPRVMVESLSASTIQVGNLQTLSCINIEIKYNEMILKLFPNLRKLSCHMYRKNEPGVPSSYPIVLDFLCDLESLKLSTRLDCIMPSELTLPSSLKKLTLKFCRFPWGLMSTIEKLSNLEILKLIDCTIIGGSKWDLSDEEKFYKLRYLKFVNLNIEIWNIASSQSFPQLQRLCFKDCNRLTEIPSNLVDIPTLRIIEVVHCGASATKSALEIQSEQEDNEWLKILVYKDPFFEDDEDPDDAEDDEEDPDDDEDPED